MKKLLYLFFLSCLLTVTTKKIVAQNPPPGVTTILFEEHFDTIPSLWKMKSSWTPTNQVNRWWRDTVVTKDKSRGSATDTINTSGQNFTAETHLTSPQISIAGYTSVGFSFDHICYVGQFNDATLQYSFDNGATWRRMPPSSYNGPLFYDYGQGDWKFSKASNPVDWRLFDTTYVWPATTSAWISENFDITDVQVSSGTQSDSVRIRFTLINDASAPRGREGTHRWIVDNFVVRGADCELIPPSMDFLDPPRNYPSYYEGRVYSEGPWDFDAKVLDASGVDTVYIVAMLKRDTSTTSIPGWDTIAVDTFPMRRLSGGNFQGQITSPIDGVPVQLADTVIWKVEAVDRSDCKNKTQEPPSGFSSFRVVNDLPKSCNTKPIYNFPYYQTFNSTNFQLTNPSTPPPIVPLAEDWENVDGDFHNWWVNSGPTLTDSTGPSGDFPDGGGNYLYVESSGYFDSTAYLITPCFDFSSEGLGNGLIRFYLNMNTNSIDDVVHVDIYDPKKPGTAYGGFVNDVIRPIRGNKGDNWIPYEFSAFAYQNTVTQLRFRATPGTNSGFGDMALDSFKIVEGVSCDLRINAIDLPPYGPAGEEDSLVVNIQNLGIADATGITFYYQTCPVGNPSGCSVEKSIFWPGTVLAGSSPLDIKLNAAYTIPKGDFYLRTRLEYGCDLVENNDTAYTNSTGVKYVAIKYRDDFDKDTLWVSLSEKNSLENSWELGQPNYDRTNSLITEPNAWDVLLDRQYTGTGITNSLISPIFDFRSGDSIIISFLNNRDIDTTKDGVWIEWSLDRGVTWNYMENFGDIEPRRWYNNTLSSGGLGGTPVFTGRSSCWLNTWGGWLESELYLPDTLYNKDRVMLRFQFFAEDDEDGNDGMSIDNILIYDPEPLDIEPQYMLGPKTKCSLSDQTRINTIFKNRGLGAVNSFNVEYRITHIPTGLVESKTDLVNRTFDHRDTVHVVSASTFDFFKYGDYKVEIITKLPSDGCRINDTLTKMVENVEGCSLKFVIETSHRRNRQMACDSSVWRFNYTSGDRKYQVSGAYNDPEYGIGRFPNIPGDTITNLFVCIKSNSQVRFDLDDIDTLVEKFSFIAYDGENDTTILEGVGGGPDSPTQYFDWLCPPVRSASPIEIIFDDYKIQLPVAKTQGYAIEATILNNGLDSLDSVDVYLQIDNRPSILNHANFYPPLKYNRKRRVSWQNQYLEPGVHEFKVWTARPNGQVDMLPSDDTTGVMMSIMDTLPENLFPPFCEDFEGNSGYFWPSLNSYNYNQQRSSFENGTPSTSVINSAFGGVNAWTTNLDGNYPNIDSSSIISPFIYMQKDSCYKISFKHNYFIKDSLQDGAQLQITSDTGSSWSTIGNSMGDSAIFGQLGWYNTLHILSIPDNSKNSGWTGNSRGWKNAENVIGSSKNQFVALRWRFESDGSNNSDGWAIDDFCIENIGAAGCLPVGLDENIFDKNELYLGQNIPNPASYNTTIPYYLPKSGRMEFVVSNIVGQQVYYEQSEHPSGDGLLQLDLSSMAKGVYFYTLIFDGNRLSNKMIVTK